MNRTGAMGTRRQPFTNNHNHIGIIRENPECNIAILGALGVGKSALTVKYITRRFIMEYDPALEDTYTKLETVDGQDIQLHIMDTYDTEHSKPDRYLKWASGFLVVYSITSRPSYDQAKTYIETITRYLRIAAKDRPIALVGNKVDLERYRTVSNAEGLSLANDFDCSFHETAAAEDFASVEGVFHSLIRDILRLNERLMPLQRLYIVEDKAVLLTTGTQSVGRYHGSRRPKSPKPPEGKETKPAKDEKEGRRSVSHFRLFNKNFKFFN